MKINKINITVKSKCLSAVKFSHQKVKNKYIIRNGIQTISIILIINLKYKI